VSEGIAGVASLAAFSVFFGSACIIGWAAGDIAFGPAWAERRGERWMRRAVPVALAAFVAFAVLLHRWAFG
jgi:hypothetical protein